MLRLMPGQHLKPADTHILRARSCTGLTLRDLTVHGAYLTLGSVGVQAHAIFVDSGCEDVVIERVGVFQSAGDAVRLLGEPNQKVRRVWVQGCRLVQNKRTGVAFQRCVEFVWVTGLLYRDRSSEHTGGDRLRAIGNGIRRAARSACRRRHRLQRPAAQRPGGRGITLWPRRRPGAAGQFTNNVLLGGVMGGVNAHDVTISGNTVITGDTVLAADTGQVMLLRGSFDGLRVTDNKIVATTGQLDGIHLSRIDHSRCHWRADHRQRHHCRRVRHHAGQPRQPGGA